MQVHQRNLDRCPLLQPCQSTAECHHPCWAHGYQFPAEECLEKWLWMASTAPLKKPLTYNCGRRKLCQAEEIEGSMIWAVGADVWAQLSNQLERWPHLFVIVSFGELSLKVSKLVTVKCSSQMRVVYFEFVKHISIHQWWNRRKHKYILHVFLFSATPFWQGKIKRHKSWGLTLKN